jgi:hypothetical protein
MTGRPAFDETVSRGGDTGVREMLVSEAKTAGRRAALTDEAIAVFQKLPSPPDQPPLPLDQLLELIGTAFVHTARANLDLVTILIGERRALAGDTRFVEFIDAAATRLGCLIDAPAGSEGHGAGIPDRAGLLRCPDRVRVASRPTRPGLDPAGRYRRVHPPPSPADRAWNRHGLAAQRPALRARHSVRA